jgi:hypothetical protein
MNDTKWNHSKKLRRKAFAPVSLVAQSSAKLPLEYTVIWKRKFAMAFYGVEILNVIFYTDSESLSWIYKAKD